MKDEKTCCKATINVILFAKHVSNHDVKGKHVGKEYWFNWLSSGLLKWLCYLLA